MNQEVEFARTLEEVRKTAKAQGNQIRTQQIKEAFDKLNLSDDQLSMVYDYLAQRNITVAEELTEVSEEDLWELEEFTPEEKDYLKMYLDELELLPTYSDGEKKAYTISAMAGEIDAQKTLINIYLKDVVGIARIYTGQGVLLEDLIGEGNVALSMGVTMLGSQETPDECEGVLMKMVMDAMEDLIRETGEGDEVAKKAADRVNRINEKAKALSEELGRKVTVEELAAEEHLSKKAILDALRISGFALDSIEVPGSEGEV